VIRGPLIRLSFAIAASISLLTPVSAFAQIAPVELRYVVQLGSDTIGVEAARLTRDSIVGTVLRRELGLRRVDYRAALNARGAVVSFTALLSELDASGWRELRRVGIETAGDSAFVSVGDGQPARRVLAAEAQVAVPGSVALFALGVSTAARATQDSVRQPLLAPLGGPGGTLITRRQTPTSIQYRLVGGFATATLGTDGLIAAVDASATTLKENSTRVSALDVEEVARSWARAPRPGALSGRDTVLTEIAGARVWIDYGRPSVRGRDVFKDGVLGDTIWRLGANAATQLETSHTLRLGSDSIPPGRYSLFLRYTDAATQLIVNRRNGQWGTQYDPAMNLISIPLTRRALDDRVELLEINVSANGERSGRLSIRWDRTEFSGQFEVAGRAAVPPSL
jgi:hypothetical protein